MAGIDMLSQVVALLAEKIPDGTRNKLVLAKALRRCLTPATSVVAHVAAAFATVSTDTRFAHNATSDPIPALVRSVRSIVSMSIELVPRRRLAQ